MSSNISSRGCGGSQGAGRAGRHQREHNEVSCSLKGGKLSVHGTDGADKLSVTRNGDNVEVRNGDQIIGTFPASQVQKVAVHGHKGKDEVNVDVGEGIKVRALGGRGRDTINVANATDAFVGAKYGKDTINLENCTGTRIKGGRGADTVNARGVIGAPAPPAFVGDAQAAPEDPEAAQSAMSSGLTTPRRLAPGLPIRC